MCKYSFTKMTVDNLDVLIIVWFIFMAVFRRPDYDILIMR